MTLKASSCNSDSLIKLIFPVNSSFSFCQASLCPQSRKQQMAPAYCVQVVTLKQFYNDQESQIAKGKAVLGGEQHTCAAQNTCKYYRREQLSGAFSALYIVFPCNKIFQNVYHFTKKNPPGSHVRKVLC